MLEGAPGKPSGRFQGHEAGQVVGRTGIQGLGEGPDGSRPEKGLGGSRPESQDGGLVTIASSGAARPWGMPTQGAVDERSGAPTVCVLG